MASRTQFSICSSASLNRGHAQKSGERIPRKQQGQLVGRSHGASSLAGGSEDLIEFEQLAEKFPPHQQSKCPILKCYTNLFLCMPVLVALKTFENIRWKKRKSISQLISAVY